MAPIPGLQGALERSFEEYPCIIATGLGGLAVAGVQAGQAQAAGLLVPAVLMYGAKCLGKYPTIPPPGYGRTLLGGQCLGIYDYKIRFKDRQSGGPSGEPNFTLTGPVRSIETSIRPNAFGNPTWFIRIVHNGGVSIVDESLGLNSNIWEFDRESLLRADGQPDNCGNGAPTITPSLPPTNPYPPQPPGCPPGSICIPQYEPIVVVPSSNGGKPTYLPIFTPPIIIPITPVFPITVPINLGGIKIGEINVNFNGEFTININEPATQSQDYTAILNEIKACACEEEPPPVCPSEQRTVPYLDSANSQCSIKTETITIVPGGFPATLAQKLQSTASAALSNCQSTPPDQKAEVLLGVGTVPFPATEQFVTGILPEIVSVRLKIKSFSESVCPSISTFPAANQRKFGSIGFSLPPAAAGGDYVYVFDVDTYLPLPPHGKEGLIRLLLRAGTEWEVYDTGERL